MIFFFGIMINHDKIEISSIDTIVAVTTLSPLCLGKTDALVAGGGRRTCRTEVAQGSSRTALNDSKLARTCKIYAPTRSRLD